MEKDKALEKLKKQYDNINVKQEGVFIMKKSIEKAKKENKNNLIKYISVACILGLTTFVVLPNLNTNIAMAMSKIPIIGKIVEVVTINDYNDDSKNINVEAPIAKDTTNDKPLDELNAKTDSYIKMLIDKFKDDFKSGDNKSLDITYDIITDNENLFTLKINGLEINASGYMFSKIYNVDKNTGNILELKDIFKKDSNYINIISEDIKRQMKEQMDNDESKVYFLNEDIPTGNFEKIDENQNFYFNKDNNLVICFDEYEVAPGYMGTVEFIILKDVIKDILK